LLKKNFSLATLITCSVRNLGENKFGAFVDVPFGVTTALDLFHGFHGTVILGQPPKPHTVFTVSLRWWYTADLKLYGEIQDVEAAFDMKKPVVKEKVAKLKKPRGARVPPMLPGVDPGVFSGDSGDEGGGDGDRGTCDAGDAATSSSGKAAMLHKAHGSDDDCLYPVPGSTSSGSATASSSASGDTRIDPDTKALDEKAMLALASGKGVDFELMEALVHNLLACRSGASGGGEADDKRREQIAEHAAAADEAIADTHEGSVVLRVAKAASKAESSDLLRKSAASNSLFATAEDSLAEVIIESHIFGRSGGGNTNNASRLEQIQTMQEVWQETFQAWSYNVVKGVDALARCHMDKDVPCGRSHPFEMSLIEVAVGPESLQDRLVHLVHWSNPKSDTGRPVEIRDGHAVYPMRHVSVFTDVRVIHPAIGVHMKRSKQDRAAVPRWVQRLKDMHEVALGASDPLDTCFICNEVVCIDDGSRCRLCLTSAHTACREVFVGHQSFVEDSSSVAPPNEAVLGIRFCKGALCKACRSWIAED
jgi:hypothetical protein